VSVRKLLQKSFTSKHIKFILTINNDIFPFWQRVTMLMWFKG